MTAKELLLQYENAIIKEKILRDFISSQRKMIKALYHIPGRLDRQMKEDLSRLEKKLTPYEEELVGIPKTKQKIFDLITEIPGLEGEVLIRRYVNGEIWEEICDHMHYSWNSVFKIHRRALQMAQDRLDQGTFFDT
ncbi:MAG: hypothetical protein IJJ06_02235 [Mogibacterium sp.]|nr:hypothetical protein [Mogibacterium sp.]